MSAETLFREFTNISLYISATLCVLLVFVRAPQKQSLRPYRITRHALILSFFLVTLLNLGEIYQKNVDIKHHLVILDTLVISSYQIFFFAATLITMLDFRSYTSRKVLMELLPTTAFSIIGYLFFLTEETLLLHVWYWIFGAYYVLQLIRYTFFYVKVNRNTVKKLDNFFSEETARRLKWTGGAFLWLFLGGILSFLSLFLNVWFSLFFTVFYTLFYIYFCIHYLNYVTLFLDMEPAFSLPDESLTKEKSVNKTFEQLEKAIDQWEKEKHYSEPGITIEQVAAQLNSNRTYLSTHMNLHRKITFKEWINTLRIEEAKILLKNNSDTPVSQIGMMVGLPDKSNFGRQFSRLTGKSPQAWRKGQ
ncbi:MAG TPA: AraC family transcriptional regulator [Bacteroidales bacterium]|nr:AraC family transcriptional regulator [Bacteroidales bacterium]